MDDHRDSLLEACLKNHAYDVQCEPSRARWLMPLLSDELRAELLKRLAQVIPSGKPGRHRYQQLELCLELAKAGHSLAGNLLRDNVRPGLNDEWEGLDEVLELDGTEGLRQICERIVAQVSGGESVSDALRRVLVRWSGEQQAARDVFEDSASLRAYTRIFEVDKRSDASRPDRGQAIGISVDELLEMIDSASGSYRPWLVPWARNASESQIEQVARVLAGETSVVRLKQLLRIFSAAGRRTLPCFETYANDFLRLAGHEDWHVRSWMCSALGSIRHPRIRAMALERLEEGRWLANELELFKSNLEPGDAQRMARCLSMSRSAEKHHRMVFDVLEVCEANPWPEMQGLMLMGYETSPCANCRNSLYGVLVSGGLLPEWIEREWPYDVYDDRFEA